MSEGLQIKSASELHQDIDKFIEDFVEDQMKRTTETIQNTNLGREKQIEIITKIFQQKIPNKEEILKYLSRCVIFQDNIYFAPETILSQDNNSIFDKTFLHEVNIFNPSMFSLAEKLLKEIRKIYPSGQLKKESIHHFVESPENFWSVWNQVNKGDLAISIYGTPFNYETSLILTEYDRSYSKFYITNERELGEGIKLIRQALEKKGGFG